MLRRNLDQNEENFKRNKITRQQYQIRKKDAQSRISELKNQSK